MGNGVSHCFNPSLATGPPSRRRRRHVTAAVTSEPLDEGIGHSFCYVLPSSSLPSAASADGPAALLPSISGASVSANPSTALSTSLSLDPNAAYRFPAAFESSDRFSSIPLQPIPRFPSGPLSGPLIPDHRGFLSGPIKRSFLSGPLPFERPIASRRLKRSLSQSVRGLRGLSRAIHRTLGRQRNKHPKDPISAENSSGFISVDEIVDKDSNLQWAQGKAGEDRVHVVISEEKGWVFVGIYDGFNGPDATDYLLSNLYSAVQDEMERLDLAVESNHNHNYSHSEVLKALSRALMKTEETFLNCADMMVSENPELSLMGSCVLVMLMRGDDVYLMNVGDSRAVLARKGRKDLDEMLELDAVQLTLDHSTSVQEEVIRIKKEHPDDSLAISNDRVKGSLKVTRAFGAGFLKQPKWNDALLEMFRIDYIGTSPYITCNPSLYHHRLGAADRFLILSSDGLYQYFTNEEAVAEVELFISTTPEGDPAQHLLEELLFRAAKKAGMDFHELLEIPQGDRRRYHDDVSVIVISLEGRIWRSSM